MAYAQQDPAWRDAVLGFGPDTIGEAGCFLTSDADLMLWIGRPTTPAQLNQAYKQHPGIFSSGDLLASNALEKAYPNLWQLEGIFHYGDRPADLKQLNNSAAADFVQVQISTRTVPTHFMPIYNWAGGSPNKITVCDSWDGHVKPLSVYGDPATIIVQVIRHRALTTPPRPAPKPPPAPKPAPRPKPRTYVVHAGDTLSSIAARFHTSVARLVAINSIRDPNLIKVGQVLRLP